MSKVLDLNELFPEPINPDVPRGPLPKQQELLDAVLDPAGPKYVGYMGGVGCLAADELVQTERGLTAIAKIHPTDAIVTQDRLVSGILPFPAGKDYLYRVQHEHGEFVAPLYHRLLCSDGKYLSVEEIFEQKKSFAVFPSPHHSSLEFSQSESLLDEQRLTQTLADWLDRCLTCFHLYGPLPPQVLDIAQACLPLLSDAPKSVQTSWKSVCEHMGDLTEQGLSSSRQDQSYARLSKLGYQLRISGQVLVEEGSALTSPSAPSLQASPIPEPDLKRILSRLRDQLGPDSYTSEMPSFTPSKILKITPHTSSITHFWDLSIPNTANYYGKNGELHHNSGKSLVLCTAVLIQAIIYGGEFVIARQFMPELRRTTMATFKEICPKELILEERVADAEFTIKSASGKPAKIMFLGLDDPDKLRSLNLSGFAIDEATQVSEYAFTLLQGRLRNRLGLRKGILVGNPAGHDYIYRYFVAKDVFNYSSEAEKYHMIIAPSTENVHLPEGYVESLMGSWSKERINRDIYGSFDSFEGQIYDEFNRNVHIVRPFKIPGSWEKTIGIDHGYRNPAAWIWVARDEDDNLYVYQEYYQREKLVSEICDDVRKLMGRDIANISAAYIDPSVKAKRGEKTAWDEYVECLPKDFPLLEANNDVSPGIDKVKQYLKIDQKTRKPRLYIFDTCVNLIEEMAAYRWKPQRDGDIGRKEAEEKPLKLNDHANDALRYCIHTHFPEIAPKERKLPEHLSKPGARAALHQEIQGFKRGRRGGDPFEGF